MTESAVIGRINYDAALKVLADSGLDFVDLSRRAQQPGFRAVPLRSRASVAIDIKIRRQVSHNVIGILRGRSRPGEYFMHVAHWDALGRCLADATGDDICNGAVDDASGVAGLVALAEAHVRAGPTDRSLLFLAVTGEENGLLGSRFYADHPIYPLAKTVGGFNMDPLSVKPAGRNLITFGGEKSELFGYLARAAATQGLKVEPEPLPEQGFYYRSDHFSFAQRGVPVLVALIGDDLLVGGKAAHRALMEDWGRNRYHKPGDEYDPEWDWGAGLQELRLAYDIGRELANSTDWPNWREGDEFRSIRDSSRRALSSQ